jgi:predicted SAM-dependent methyltransferase
MKLNLGSGHRNLVGYTNVDIDPRADVVHDIRRLPFEDESADEVLSVHAIEHFFRWEVVDILKEWRRVLKPGGKLVLECPDLTKIIRNFLAGEPPRMTIMGLYCDPAVESEVMVHKWAYNYPELRSVVEEAGFKDVREEAPQWHFAKRDMRIEAWR